MGRAGAGTWPERAARHRQGGGGRVTWRGRRPPRHVLRDHVAALPPPRHRPPSALTWRPLPRRHDSEAEGGAAGGSAVPPPPRPIPPRPILPPCRCHPAPPFAGVARPPPWARRSRRSAPRSAPPRCGGGASPRHRPAAGGGAARQRHVAGPGGRGWRSFLPRARRDAAGGGPEPIAPPPPRVTCRGAVAAGVRRRVGCG